MTLSPLALSLSGSLTQVGAIAACAALLGIAVLSLLSFSQAREIRRLREWAGRAPERAAELQQRVGAEAATPAPRPGTGVTGVQSVRPMAAGAPAPAGSARASSPAAD